MLEEDEYPSDSDQSDEDYNPDGNKSEAGSEVESDGDAESGDEAVVAKQSESSKPGKRKSKSQGSSRRKSRRLDGGTAEVDSNVADEDEKAPATAIDEEAEKKRDDALWADFLSDTAAVRPDPSKPAKKEQQADIKKDVAVESTSKASPLEKKEEPKVPEKKTITEIFEFAGEKVEVQKVVEVGNGSSPAEGNGPSGRKSSVAGRAAGIGSFLNQLGSAKKISVLEKSKLDWNSFKQKEGIDEDLQTHNKGKGGYLERQDFLQRTDLRQFELEKSQRMSSRRK